MLKHCLSLKTIIPNFVAFVFIVRNYNILHSQDVILGHFSQTRVYAGHCFIIHLPGGGQCPLVRDSEPIRSLQNTNVTEFVYANLSYYKLDVCYFLKS